MQKVVQIIYYFFDINYVLIFLCASVPSDNNYMKRLLNANTSSFFVFHSSKTPVN